MVEERMRVQWMFNTGWRQEGHLAGEGESRVCVGCVCVCVCVGCAKFCRITLPYITLQNKFVIRQIQECPTAKYIVDLKCTVKRVLLCCN